MKLKLLLVTFAIHVKIENFTNKKNDNLFTKVLFLNNYSI